MHIPKLNRNTYHLSKLLMFISFLNVISGCNKFDAENVPQSGNVSENNSTGTTTPVKVSSVDNSILAYYPFENEIGNWPEKSTCCSWSAQLNKNMKRGGKSSLRVELRTNDLSNGHRSELGQVPNKNKEGWFGFSVYFPSSFVKDPSEESIVQWQALPDFSIGETWRSPPLFLGVLNDRFVLEIRTDSKKVTEQGNYSFTRIDLGMVDKETWLDWAFHIKWAYDNTGVVEVWKNNKLIVSRINKPNAYNDVMFPYFKIGIYKWGWANPGNTTINNRIIFIDEVTIGNEKAGYDKVYPDKLTLLAH